MKGFGGIAMIGALALIVIAAAFLSGIVNVGTIGLGTDLSHFFHTNIDAVNEDFLDEARSMCEVFDGEWRDEPGAIGCFDMPDGVFDDSNCGMPAYKAFETMCSSVHARFSCDGNNLGCSY